MPARQNVFHLGPVTLATVLLVTAIPALAQKAGEVEYAQGVGFAQAPGQTPRTMGRGLPLAEGDRLTTADGGIAIVKLEDGTRMTVRPNSELVLQQYRYKDNASDNSMLMQLVRGGFRAVTGLIAKSSPNAARVQTSTATIGIRGTDFDARLCGKDCGVEAQAINAQAKPNAVQASARLALAQGRVDAVDTAGTKRRLVEGGSVYPGDVVEISPDSRAALVFRDESRITLGPVTRFRVDNFVYDEKNAGDGRLLVSLLRGSMRALTGLIGKTNTRNVGYSTATATIGIRGSDIGASCEGRCAGEPDDGKGLSVFVFEGGAQVGPNPGTPGTPGFQPLELALGNGAFFGQQGVAPLLAPPPIINALPPRDIPLPPNFFTRADIKEAEEGLHVLVRDGHIEMDGPNGQVLHLGKGESGFVGFDGRTGSPINIPRPMLYDPIPQPTLVRNIGLIQTLNQTGVQVGNVCN